MTGALNRVVRLATRPGEARGVVEDDFHHFRVTVHHDGTTITRVETAAPRYPWSLCPAAGLQLQPLVGTPLRTRVTDVFRLLDARHQCTHQFDLAGSVVAAAARGIARRRFDILVPDKIDERTTATLRRDGVEIYRWDIDDNRITNGEHAGVSLGAGFTGHCDAQPDDDVVEAMLVFRRGIFISGGRKGIAWLDAREYPPGRSGCWVQQPERLHDSSRMVGSTHDFTDNAATLTASDEEWLAFTDQREPADIMT